MRIDGDVADAINKSKNDFYDKYEYLKPDIEKSWLEEKWDSACEWYNVPLVKTQMKKIIVTAKTLYSHPKNVSKIYAALHTDLAW